MSLLLDVRASAAVRAAYRRIDEIRHRSLDPVRTSIRVLNEKAATAWDLLIETRRDVRRATRQAKPAPLKTGRYAR